MERACLARLPTIFLRRAKPNPESFPNPAASSPPHHCSGSLQALKNCSAQHLSGLCAAACTVADVTALPALSTVPKLAAWHGGAEQLCIAETIMKTR